MEKNGALDHLKAEDKTIVSEIIAMTHEVYNTDEYLKKEATKISDLEARRVANSSTLCVACE